MNEIVGGVAGFDNVAVTMFAGGSGNDFIRIFDQPEAFRDLNRLLDAEEVAFDLIKVNDDYSLNICSVGLDARIAADVAAYKRLPLLSGFRAYAASTVVNLLKGITEHYVIEIDGQRIDGKKTMICACNGRFYGGGFNPVPEADPTDGKLDVLVVDAIGLLQVPAVIGKYKNGQYKQLPKLVKHYRTDKLKIYFDKPTAMNLDGEQVIADAMEISVAKEKVRFFYPKGLTWKSLPEKELTTV
jgi:diacylglycerol kinase family enzyme